MSVILPKAITDTINTLEKAGFEAWCVGGAVRDLTLGKTPYDYDITTNALPDDIILLFEKTVPTGIKHGTVTVIADGSNIEVTTYRSDGGYTDHRAPDSVSFIASVEEDVKRRDFTVNSILYNPEKGFYDPENGIADINAKTIRAVGEPDKRFKEDALRILRAFRFSAQLDFSIEPKTLTSAVTLSPLLKEISVERVFSELHKIFLSDRPERCEPLFSHNAFRFCGINGSDFGIMSRLPRSFPLRFAYYCTENRLDAKAILKTLKADNKTADDSECYMKILSSPIPTEKRELKRLMHLFGSECVEIYCNADELHFNKNPHLAADFRKIIEKNEPFMVSQLDISGTDLMSVGLKGAEIGKTLNTLLEAVINDPGLNKKDILINLI